MSKHPSGCDLRPDGTPYHTVTCAGCFGRITFAGEAALVMHAESRGLTWCDETCRIGSGVRFRWEPGLSYGDVRDDMRRVLVSRRRDVQEGRR